MKLYEAIANARKYHNLSLRQLEKKTGISNALLWQMETGAVKNPSFRNIVKLSEVLKIPLARLAKTE